MLNAPTQVSKQPSFLLLALDDEYIAAILAEHKILRHLAPIYG